MDAIATIKNMVQDAERHADDTHKERTRAVEYYRGEMRDTPTDPNRSKMVKRVLRSQIKKVLPSLMRTLLGNTAICEFLPVGQGDEAEAEQKTDYFNAVTVKDANVRRTIEDALHDALLLKNGIVRWWWEEKTEPKFSKHTGILEEQLAVFVADPDVEVLEQEQREEMVETEQGPMPVVVYDLKTKRYTKSGKAMSAAVPRERFLIHPDATCIEDSPITGVKDDSVTRSDLVAMGYDKKLVWSLAVDDEEDDDDIRRDKALDVDEVHKANEKVTYYDLFIRFDKDGDGIAELRHMCFGGTISEQGLLMDEEADEVQFADIAVMSQPHQWEGISLSDDLMDLQQAETVLLRQTLDNLYWQNNPQPIGRPGAIENWEAVLNPEFGLAIKVKEGFTVAEALTYAPVPFVAEKSFNMLNYLDDEASERTGVSDASSGLAPDALQNMTAKASAMIEQAGIGQTELMVQTAAQGVARLCQGLMRLTIKHQDVPKTVRLRDEWVQVDPRQWNADMDVEVNVGLGAGTRERDMQVMQLVINLQERIATMLGPDNPFVKPEDFHAAISKFIEAAGLRTPDLYFSAPDPQEIEAAKQQPDPETVKMQAEMELEQQKLQVQSEGEKMKAEVQRDKERAQMEADLAVERARIEADTVRNRQELESKLALKQAEIAWEREKQANQFAHDMEVARMNQETERQKAEAATYDDMLNPIAAE